MRIGLRFPSGPGGNMRSHELPTRLEVDMDVESLEVERLEREIGELAAHIHAARYRWRMVLAELDRGETAGTMGARSAGGRPTWGGSAKGGAAGPEVLT